MTELQLLYLLTGVCGAVLILCLVLLLRKKGGGAEDHAREILQKVSEESARTREFMNGVGRAGAEANARSFVQFSGHLSEKLNDLERRVEDLTKTNEYRFARMAEDDARQLAWIDSVLTAAREDWVIVVGHHPIYADTDKNESERGDLQKRLDPILRKHANVSFYLCGHIHNFQHIRRPGAAFDYVVNTSGSLSRPVRKIEGTQFCSDVTGFSLITADKKELALHLIDRDGRVVYSVRRTK